MKPARTTHLCKIGPNVHAITWARADAMPSPAYSQPSHSPSVTTAHEHHNVSSAAAVAVCLVAAYHYMKLVNLYEQETNDPSTKTSFREQTDAVRYSDWFVTLPGLAIELNFAGTAKDAETCLKHSFYIAALLIAMTIAGYYWRFYDNRRAPTLPLIVAWLCLAGALTLNIWWVFHDDILPGETLLFSGPWVFYGFFAILYSENEVSAKDNHKNNDINALRKHYAFCLLDIWCKAIFAGYSAAHRLQYL